MSSLKSMEGLFALNGVLGCLQKNGERTIFIRFVKEPWGQGDMVSCGSYVTKFGSGYRRG